MMNALLCLCFAAALLMHCCCFAAAVLPLSLQPHIALNNIHRLCKSQNTLEPNKSSLMLTST